MKLYVICANDRPYQVMPVGTTEEQVEAHITKLREKEKTDKIERDHQSGMGGNIWYWYEAVSMYMGEV